MCAITLANGRSRRRQDAEVDSTYNARGAGMMLRNKMKLKTFSNILIRSEFR